MGWWRLIPLFFPLVFPLFFTFILTLTKSLRFTKFIAISNSLPLLFPKPLSLIIALFQPFGYTFAILISITITICFPEHLTFDFSFIESVCNAKPVSFTVLQPVDIALIIAVPKCIEQSITKPLANAIL
jgi:hypothetical protein